MLVSLAGLAMMASASPTVAQIELRACQLNPASVVIQIGDELLLIDKSSQTRVENQRFSLTQVSPKQVRIKSISASGEYQEFWYSGCRANAQLFRVVYSNPPIGDTPAEMAIGAQHAIGGLTDKQDQ